LKKGLNVIISSRSQDSVDNVVEEILDKFPSKKENILGLKCDVSKHSEVKTLVDVSVKRFGRIDVLVNNAGIVYFKNIMDTTEEEWDKTIDTNLKGVFLFTKEVLPYMIENKSGVIINVSSGAGKYGFPNLSAYCASKFGVIGLTESIAKEVTDTYNVKIMAICPGGVDTKMIEDIVYNGYTLYNRKLMKPEQIANKIMI
jgi:3-oxoacyl-[acyl-carrier protein] reductase